MKHYFSFLVLSLSVFLSLVCPSPVMAELVSSLKVEAEDGLDIEVLDGNDCSPSNMSLNTESKFGEYSGTGGMISPQSGGEVYLPLVINYNGASYGSMTVDFQIRCGNNDNGRTYINFYQECAENASPDLRISSSGSYYNKYYKKVGYQQVYGGSWYEAYQTHTVNRSFTEGSYLIGLFARDYAIYDYVQINTSAAIIQDGDAEPSCTKPSSVIVAPTKEAGNYGWRYTLGETIKLTATATGGTPSSYTYQWKKKTGPSTWKDLSDGVDATDGGTFSGTTSANLEISGCTRGNAGTYKCVVSTGAECSTESNEYWVRVFSLNGNYSGSSFVENPIVWSDEYNGTATITLNANSVYEFKVTDNDGHWYGKNTPIYKDEDNFWIYRSDGNNVALHTGKVTGTYTFTVNIHHANDDNNPYCTLTAVRYPKMTIYMSGGNTTWCDANPVFFAHTYGQANNDVKMTAHACESGLFYADVPSYNTKVTFTRQKPGSESIAWNGDNFWNKSKDEIVIGSNNKFTCTDWDNNEGVFSGSTYSPSTYTITFADNGSDGGSAMSDVEGILCGESHTLVANTWERSGYTFTGWKTNVAISTSAGDIPADGIVPNEATIQNITQDITLTAQWAAAAGKTVPCSLGFYYTKTGGKDDKEILDSDFSYSCNKDIAKNDQHEPNLEVCFSGAGHTLTSRMTVTFPSTGTYTFTFPLYIKESGNYDAPRVTVNGQQSDLATISTTGAENRNYETTLNVTTAGTYTVYVWIGNTNEKVFFSTMDITSYQSGNIITTGAEGLFSDNVGSGGNASYTCSSVADPECHFNHNVFCFEYSNMGGNSDNYYGCRLTNGPAYTPNAAATGFAFWYRTESESDPVYMEFAGRVYNLAATNRAWHYAYVAADDAKTKNENFEIWINGYKNEFSTTQSSGKIYLSELQATNVTSADPIEPSTHHIITVASNNNTYGTVSSTPASGSSVADCASITVTATPESGYSFVAWKKGDTQVSTDASYTFTMSDHNDGSDLTLTAYFQQNVLTISSLPWEGPAQELTEGTVVSAEAFNSCFDTEITFTFTGEGTVNYYDNNDRNTSLGTVPNGQPIELTEALRAHGIYIRCTTGEATLTRVSKTTIGAVYEIWSAEKNSLGAVAVGSWEQQVVLGPEHFQRATEGDVLRVYTSEEAGDAQGALQYIYTEGDDHTYLGLDNATSEGLRDWTLSDEEKDRHYFEITIEATHLANLQHYGVIVKGKAYTIQSVELRASCSNTAMPITPPDITLRGADGSIDLMAQRLVFPDNGFDLGIWEHKLELDEKCFKDVTVGSLINFYMQVQEGATISFRCNVASIEAETYDPDIPRCPSYGDISFDRTIDNLYGDAPKLIGQNKGYEVLSLLVDDDMLTRLKETGMIVCGKGACIKIVEGVPNPFVVNAGENKEIPTVVNNLEIHQGGQASNEDDIEVLGSITYFRPAQGGYWGNQLDTWYTFTLPFTVNDVEVKDMGDGNWYDINAVYYSSDDTDQDAPNNPDGAGHYYLQYLSKQDIATDRELFITRWKYITPGHSLECVSEYENGGTRYGYPKKNEAYIILFDSEQPSELAGYWESNPEIRFVGGPQTIEGIAKTWKVPSDGKEYWMYANNTLHSFTLSSAYILDEKGEYFILQSNPTIRPFECYVQATESLKTRYAALPMRGFHIDNTPTGMESMQGSAIRAEKILRNGQLIIIRNGVEYDATGAVIR